MQPEHFDILSNITNIETMAIKHSIRDLQWLNRKYGVGRWRKRKGIATIRYKKNGFVVKAENHWYEAHGIGQVEWKAKRELD